jgi:hypothetical protein
MYLKGALYLCLFLIAGVLGSHTLINHNTAQMKKPGMIHTVFFWVKEGTSNADIQAFEKGLEKLGSCPQIQSYYWGPPSSTEQRGVVDGSFTYAINVHFATIEDQNAYQEEPIHLEFIENHNAIWEKVIVYDNDVR